MTLSVALGPDTQEGTRTGTEASTDSLTAPDIPWNLVIWNDPVNLMSYVSYVFQSYFGGFGLWATVEKATGGPGGNSGKQGGSGQGKGKRG